jgi:D-glycero-D-manno-heptose 1,7-bisphosphate phosphatase
VTGAVFLDKDGTLVDDVPYNVDPDLVRLAPGAGRALRLLAEAGFRLVVVSNQSGVARGLFEESALEAVEQRLRSLLRDEGASIDAFEWCPHLVGGSVGRYAVACDCRKPAPGLLLRAAGRLGVDLRRSWIVGDILDDVEAGHAAGCRAVLVDVGSETRWDVTPARTPDAIVTSLEDAARAIVDAEDRAVARR